MNDPALFPIYLKLSGRACVVVGGGSVAEGKIKSLLEAGAKVRVISPDSTEQIAMWARDAQVTWERRHFRSDDLNDAFLVVSATNNAAINAAVREEAERRGILCNAVDDPEHCNFFYPAIVRRGPLQIAISTAGNSPALAQRLRAELEQQFGPEYEHWVRKLGERRQLLFAAMELDTELRKRELHYQASQAAFAAFLRKSPSVETDSHEGAT